MKLKKRKWVYVQSPKQYGIALHGCGHLDPAWSEYAKHLWCPQCQIDFIPEHGGIFDGPIPIHTARLMGICFDRFNLETEQIEKFEIKEVF